MKLSVKVFLVDGTFIELSLGEDAAEAMEGLRSIKGVLGDTNGSVSGPDVAGNYWVIPTRSISRIKVPQEVVDRLPWGV